jgi:hypothetical protein
MKPAASIKTEYVMLDFATDHYAGWESYPQKLDFPVLEVDASRCDERISKAADSLFVDKDESEFEYLVLEPPQEGQYFQCHCLRVAYDSRWFARS